MKLLDRYLLAELAAPFGFGVAAFTAILLASTVLFQLVTDMVAHGFGAGVVAEVLVLKLPEIVFYTFPMAMLLATLMAFGRLSGDHELVAFQAAGVSFQRMLAPVVGLALGVSLCTVALNELLVPAASWQARSLLYAAMHQGQGPLSQARDHVFYNEFAGDKLVRSFYAARFDGARMHDVVVQEFEENRLARLIQAREAAPAAQGWDFEQGTLYQVDPAGDFRYVAHFARQEVVLGGALLALSREDRQPLEMNARELATHIRRLRETGARGREVDKLSVVWHQKLAVPFASLVFALVGAPMGLSRQRGSGAIGLGLSVLVIFIYYVLMFVSTALGQVGSLPPVVAAWLPNVVAGSLGAWQLRRLATV